ncbi:unnamed protein product [Ectocarpus sp. CCAP 1310/34]|nr:unnamed protein product [Ectocarpus sp. CCAP 1310/34]
MMEAAAAASCYNPPALHHDRSSSPAGEGGAAVDAVALVPAEADDATITRTSSSSEEEKKGGGSGGDGEVGSFGYGQRWVKCEELGRGAHGTVYRALVLGTSDSIAVKQILMTRMQKSELQVAENEIGVLRRLRHPNVVPFLGVQRVGDHLNIFLEYMDGGSLRRRLDREGPMCERQTAVVTRKVLCGLAYLHSNNITHRDIKGANVLLSKKGAVKLADFGTSKPMDQDSVVSGLKGTPNWMAPEVIKNQLLPGGWLQADVWSVGCTVVEMLTGKMPWPNMPNPLCAMFKIVSGDKPPVNRNISREASSFMAACLSTKPPERYTVEQLMGHPFVVLTRSARVTASSPPQAQPPSSPNPYDDDRLDHHPRADDADRGAGVGGAGDRRHRRLYSNINKTGTSIDGGGSAAFSGTGSYDHPHRHRRHRQEKASTAGAEGRRPPCRSRETASSGKRGAWSRETGPSCGGSGSSGQGEEGQGGRWQQQQQQQQQQVTRWSDGSNDRAPLPPPPTSGSGRSSPRAAALAACQPDSSGHYGARHIHHHHHHYHHHQQQGQRRQQQQQQQQWGVAQEEPAASLYSMIEAGSTMHGTDCGSSNAEMWPHARDGSADDASGQAGQEDEGRQLLQQQLLRRYQRQQGSHSTSAPVPLVTKPDKNGCGSHAGTADRAFMTSPVMNLRPKHRNPPSPGGGFDSGGGVDVTAAAPSHGGGRDFNDDGGGGGARGLLPDCSKNSGLRRESSYNSPIQVVQAAREDLMERRKGNGGGGGGGGYGAGVAAAQHHLTRPDDPITGEYLKMGLKGLTDSSSIASRSGFNRWRSNSMPLQCMRTKSAGVLGASPKLPPLERDLSGVGGAGLYGGGQRGGEGGGGEFGASGGRFTRGITSAPSTSSAAAQYSSSPFEASADPGAIEGCGGAPAAAAAAAAAMRGCFRPVERTADRAAGLSIARPSDRSLDWSAAADKGEAVLRSRASLAPIRVKRAPKAVAAEAAAGLSLTALTITPSVSLSAAGLASGGGAAAAPCGLRGTPGAGTGSGSGGGGRKSGFPSCSTPGSASSAAALGGGARGPHHAFVSGSPSNRLDLFPLGSSSNGSGSSSSNRNR